MLLAFAGITGVGKSYFAEKVEKRLSFKKVHTIRTRKMRPGEQNGKTGIFTSKEELEQMKKEGKIVYDFEVFGGTYAYLKDEILSNEDYVFEMHYTTIKDWKKIRPDIVTIYLIPRDIGVALQKIKERRLTKEKEEERLQEIKEQYNEFMSNKRLQKMFDYIIYNDYNEKSENEIMDLVSKLMNKK